MGPSDKSKVGGAESSEASQASTLGLRPGDWQMDWSGTGIGTLMPCGRPGWLGEREVVGIQGYRLGLISKPMNLEARGDVTGVRRCAGLI